MRWDTVLPLLVARWNADSALTTALGGEHIYPANASRPVRIPSIEYLVLGQPEGESFGIIRLRVDFWAKGIALAGVIEKRLYVLTHRDVAQVLGTERMWLRFQDGRTLDYEADPGVTHRALDFEIETVRLKYV